MAGITKYHIYLCTLTASVFFFSPHVTAYAQGERSCNSLFKLYPCSALGKLKDHDEFYTDGAGINSINTLITKQSSTVVIEQKKDVNSDTGKILQLRKSGTITSEMFTPQDVATVLDAVSVTGNSKRADTQDDSITHAVFGVKQGAFLIVRNSKIDVSNVYGLVGESAPAIFSRNGSSINFQELQNMSGIFFENSKITIGGHGAFGLYFQGNSLEDEYKAGELLVKLGEIQFKSSTLKVPDGTAFYSDEARRFPYITVSDGSRVVANRLLEVKNNSYVGIEADASFLVGGAHVDSSSYAGVELYNNSRWTLKPERKGDRKKPDSWDSSISWIRLSDSSIVFERPKNGECQTLHIGKLGEDLLDYVYAAQGKAQLHVNAYLSHDMSKARSKTDKIFIYGNVYGTTGVYVRGILAYPSGREKSSKNDQSISIVQVYGDAAEDSFKLLGGYAVVKGLPYIYRLRAYAPGKSKDEHRLIKGTGGFWDFRLEGEYINRGSQQSPSKLKSVVSRRRKPRSVDSSVAQNFSADHDFVVRDPEVRVSAVVPQIPTYLLLSNALFRAGLMDISNQNKQLEELRIASGDFSKNSKNPAFFVRGYGGNYKYVSDLSALEYGYGGNFDYSAVGVGLFLKAIESANYTKNFGIMGAYGGISLQPHNVIDSKKSTFNKWSIVAYGSLQHDTGFYLDALFSYGLFKGDVFTLARGKTATLKGNSQSVSLISGKALKARYEGLVFDPQVQLIYQNLQFAKTSDIDGFDIEIGKHDQWIVRVGGRLTKTFAASKTRQVVSFSGKLHLAHSFGEKRFVHFGDKFQLGAFGSSLDAGLEFNAQLSPKFTFYGDVTYQHQLSKAGFSGTSFSGGFRYRF